MAISKNGRKQSKIKRKTRRRKNIKNYNGGVNPENDAIYIWNSKENKTCNKENVDLFIKAKEQFEEATEKMKVDSQPCLDSFNIQANNRQSGIAPALAAPIETTAAATGAATPAASLAAAVAPTEAPIAATSSGAVAPAAATPAASSAAAVAPIEAPTSSGAVASEAATPATLSGAVAPATLSGAVAPATVPIVAATIPTTLVVPQISKRAAATQTALLAPQSLDGAAVIEPETSEELTRAKSEAATSRRKPSTWSEIQAMMRRMPQVERVKQMKNDVMGMIDRYGLSKNVTSKITGGKKTRKSRRPKKKYHRSKRKSRR